MNRVRRFSFQSRFEAKFTRKTLKFPPKVMIWGCMSSKKLGNVHICTGSMNANGYIDVLRENLLPAIDKFEISSPIFMDDSAPCHRAKKVNEWKTENGIIQLDWPGNSPDLNPIENLWSHLKQKIRKKPNSTLNALISNIFSVWENDICKSYLQNLIHSMPKRIKMVIKAKGDSIKY